MLTIVVGTAIVIKNKSNEILLGLRKGGLGAGTWGLPGGKVNFGEYLIDAAKRELEEETGIMDILDSDLVHKSLTEDIIQLDKKYHFITHNFFFRRTMPLAFIKVMEPDKCDRWEYFKRDRLPSNLFDPTTHLLIRTDCDYIWS